MLLLSRGRSACQSLQCRRSAWHGWEMEVLNRSGSNQLLMSAAAPLPACSCLATGVNPKGKVLSCYLISMRIKYILSICCLRHAYCASLAFYRIKERALVGQRLLVTVEDSAHPGLFLMWHNNAKIPGASRAGILRSRISSCCFSDVETFFFF